MSGIAGIFHGNPPEGVHEGVEEAPGVRASLRHLGGRSDTPGRVLRRGCCTLLHARLAVIDLLAGEQPMSIPAAAPEDGETAPRSGPLHLVYNGEIYNHRMLRRKLERRGHVFRSAHSDSEVIPFAYRQWGPGFVRHLSGTFAFALYDEGQQRLMLCRDRLGEAPLNYHVGPGGVAFASTPAALLPLLEHVDPGCRGNRRGHAAGLQELVRFGFVDGEPLIDCVQEVPAAHHLVFDAGESRAARTRYWQPPPLSRTGTSLGAADAVDEVCTDAVEQRLESDVPLGVLVGEPIWGTTGDGLVAALAAGAARASDRPPPAVFGLRLDTTLLDGAGATHHAAELSTHLGLPYHEADVSDRLQPKPFFDEVERLVRRFGAPIPGADTLPLHWLAMHARQSVRVGLQGIGTEELFGGRRRYQAMRSLSWWYRLGLGSMLAAAGRRASPPDADAGVLRRALDAAAAGAWPGDWYASLLSQFRPRELASLMPDAVVADSLHDWPESPDAVHAAMRWDLQHLLPRLLLKRADLAGMAAGIELRSPLVATQVADLAGHLPPRVLIPRHRLGGLMRQVERRYLPLRLCRVGRPRPRGRRGSWLAPALAGPLYSGLETRLLSGTLRDAGIVEGAVRELLLEHREGRRDRSDALFTLLQVALLSEFFKQPDAGAQAGPALNVEAR